MNCSVEGCVRPRKYRDLCGTHYERRRNHGSVHATHRYDTKPKRPCSVDGCEIDARTRDMCVKHYTRWRNHGVTDLAVPIPRYAAAHDRLRAVRGKASSYQCAWCASRADEWAFTGDRSVALWEMKLVRGKHWNLPYSLDLDEYTALCRSCHRSHDGKAAA